MTQQAEVLAAARFKPKASDAQLDEDPSHEFISSLLICRAGLKPFASHGFKKKKKILNYMEGFKVVLFLLLI